MNGFHALPLKWLRTVGLYTALALGVTVGGVALGAMVVAPAVAHAKPVLQRIAGKNAPAAIAGARANLTRVVSPALRFVAKVPKARWIYIDLTAIVLVGGLVSLRRRTSAPATKDPIVQLVAAVSAKAISGKSSRTPRAVVALAESGASPADIARRTRMPLDAVAMCLSMGSLEARQLRPPTA